LAATLDNRIRLWDYMSATPVKTYTGHANHKFCAAAVFATAGPRPVVVAGGEDHRVCIWDVQSRELLQTLEGHTDTVLALDAHPRLEVLATGGTDADKSIKLWSDDSRGNGLAAMAAATP
jgi:COMPASS component SWD3